MQTSPVKALRERCLNCCGASANEVKLCPVQACPLHAFRFGKNPFIRRQYTEEQRETLRERMNKLNSAP